MKKSNKIFEPRSISQTQTFLAINNLSQRFTRLFDAQSIKKKQTKIDGNGVLRTAIKTSSRTELFVRKAAASDVARFYLIKATWVCTRRRRVVNFNLDNTYIVTFGCPGRNYLMPGTGHLHTYWFPEPKQNIPFPKQRAPDNQKQFVHSKTF